VSVVLVAIFLQVVDGVGSGNILVTFIFGGGGGFLESISFCF